VENRDDKDDNREENKEIKTANAHVINTDKPTGSGLSGRMKNILNKDRDDVDDLVHKMEDFSISAQHYIPVDEQAERIGQLELTKPNIKSDYNNKLKRVGVSSVAAAPFKQRPGLLVVRSRDRLVES